MKLFDIVFLIFLFIVGFGSYILIKQKRTWNNGKCPTCNNEWKYYFSTEKGTYYYCPRCKTIIFM